MPFGVTAHVIDKAAVLQYIVLARTLQKCQGISVAIISILAYR